MSSTKSTQSAIGAAPTSPARFELTVPRELREEADSMSPDAFRAKYTPSVGPLRLGNWECTDADRPASRLGPQARNYQATIAFGERIGTSTAAASGPIAALTAMLGDRGIAVEVRRFHQFDVDADVATYIHGSNGARDEWAMGLSEDPTQSALRALIACANRLYPERD